MDEEGKPDERPTIPTQLSPRQASPPPKILDPVLAWGRRLAANPLGSSPLGGTERRRPRTGETRHRGKPSAGEEDGEGDGGERGKGEG